MLPENAIKVVLACCVFHNFVRRREGVSLDNIESNEIDNSWFQMEGDTSATIGRPGKQAIDIRDEFAEIFLITLSVPWQFDRAQLTDIDSSFCWEQLEVSDMLYLCLTLSTGKAPEEVSTSLGLGGAITLHGFYGGMTGVLPAPSLQRQCGFGRREMWQKMKEIVKKAKSI
ncbi:hypothetical protein PoB_001170400 [Plakobranchus ocellatus]|uniref:Nuclease HARBI1 n=1 Tax=Plakobranchus ocellatus TaxID=259542 RepID=A0AAV3YQA2_9GAST|nr:hypothetical protein PoB_001170400 [Plakobranchus ocellatus]